MDSLWLNFEETRTRWKPGETLAGRAGWQLGEEPKKIELRLFWYTAGIGTRDIEVIECVPFDPPRANDERPFSLHLPEGPYSFAGKLVSLTWAVELVIDPGERTQRVEIELTPFDEPIVLEKIEMPKKSGFHITTNR